MRFQAYVDALRRRRDRLAADRAFITERGMQMRSNWGYTTNSRLAELDRRIRELSAIIAAFETRHAI